MENNKLNLIDNMKKSTEKRLENRKKFFDSRKDEFEQYISDNIEGILSCEYNTDTHTLEITSNKQLISTDIITNTITSFVTMLGETYECDDWSYNIVPYNTADVYEYSILL